MKYGMILEVNIRFNKKTKVIRCQERYLRCDKGPGNALAWKIASLKNSDKFDNLNTFTFKRGFSNRYLRVWLSPVPYTLNLCPNLCLCPNESL